MNKLLFCALVFLSFPLYAQDSQVSLVKQTDLVPTPTLTSAAEVKEDEKVFNPRESHWLTTLGAEGLSYKVPFQFDGVRKDLTPTPQALWGTRLGLGGELYLGAGFTTSTKVEGYYVGTLFTRTETADPDVSDVEFAFTKRTGQVYGGDLVQSLGYIFDLKTKNPLMDEMTYLTVEPFVEAGVGYAQAYNRMNYHYDTGNVAGSSQVREDYRVTMEEGIINQRIGAGINFISRKGYYLYLRSTVNRYDISKRKIRGSQRYDDATFTDIDEDVKNPKMRPVTIYALGGGLKF